MMLPATPKCLPIRQPVIGDGNVLVIARVARKIIAKILVCRLAPLETRRITSVVVRRELNQHAVIRLLGPVEPILPTI